MASIYLHGGGDHADSRAATFGRFLAAASAGRPCRVSLVIAEANHDDSQASYKAYGTILATLGLNGSQMAPIFVSPESPLMAAAIAEQAPSAILVCGGMTPRYHGALCADQSWVSAAQAAGVVYCGTSAGAAVAANSAILGGWRAERSGQERLIVFPGAGEGLELLSVRPGLGLVPFAVEVHASQWGTLTRLIQTVDLGLAAEGWALDEDTLLVVGDGDPAVYGRGHAYHVRRGPDGLPTVRVVTAG